MKKAVIYARFSSDNQREESIDAQVRAIEEYAERNNIIITNCYIDEAKSATTDNRPAFQQMINESERKNFDYVIVHKLDRFSRDRYDSAIYKRKLKLNGISVLSVLENLDNSPESIILESVLEGMNEYYSKNLAREVKKGMKENALNCKWNGGTPPLGYDLDENKKLVINEYEANAVRLIYDMYVAGNGYSVIIDTLNDQGYRTKLGNNFSKNSLYEILRNEKYIGNYVYNRRKRNSNGSYNNHKESKNIIRIENGIPKIIEKEVWNKVQTIRMSNKRKSSSKAKNLYLLSGIIYCGECGGKMSGHSTTQKYKSGETVRTEYYVCIDKKKKRNNCSSKMIRADKLEKTIVNMFSDILFTESNIDAIIKSMKQYLLKNNKTDIPKLKDELSNIEKEIQNFVTAISNGINSETMVDKINELELKKSTIKSQIYSETLKANSLYSDEQLKEFLMQHKNFKEFSDLDKKRILQLFIKKITISKEEIKIELNLIDLAHVDLNGRGEASTPKSILKYYRINFNIIRLKPECLKLVS